MLFFHSSLPVKKFLPARKNLFQFFSENFFHLLPTPFTYQVYPFHQPRNNQNLHQPRNCKSFHQSRNYQRSLRTSLDSVALFYSDKKQILLANSGDYISPNRNNWLECEPHIKPRGTAMESNKKLGTPRALLSVMLLSMWVMLLYMGDFMTEEKYGFFPNHWAGLN